ncbi:MAG: transposase [Candidatus Heimdallarchaeota archaeon]
MPKLLKVTRPVDKDELNRLYKTSENPRVRIRLLMVHHVSQGKSCHEVSKLLLVKNDTVMKWIRRFNEYGFERLEDEDRSGRPAKVDYKKLKDALHGSPKDFDYPYEAWFPRIVYLYLFDHQNQKEMNPNYVYEVIKRAGFRLLVPKGRHYKSDAKEVEEFKKKWHHTLVPKA